MVIWRIIVESWLTGFDDALDVGREVKVSVYNAIITPLLLLIDYDRASNTGPSDLLHGQGVVNEQSSHSLFLQPQMRKAQIVFDFETVK